MVKKRYQGYAYRYTLPTPYIWIDMWHVTWVHTSEPVRVEGYLQWNQKFRKFWEKIEGPGTGSDRFTKGPNADGVLFDLIISAYTEYRHDRTGKRIGNTETWGWTTRNLQYNDGIHLHFSLWTGFIVTGTIYTFVFVGVLSSTVVGAILVFFGLNHEFLQSKVGTVFSMNNHELSHHNPCIHTECGV